MQNPFAKYLVAALIGCAVWTQVAALGLGGLGNSPVPAGQDQVLAQGPGGSLTSDAVAAYAEALEFCLGQVGSQTRFGAADRQQIQQILTRNFPTMPVETQSALANARPTWTQYRQSWDQLTLDQKKAFAYDVLSLAYGDAAAGQALGMSGGNGGGGSSGSAYSGYSEPCTVCTEEGSLIYGGATDLGGGEFSY
jgi:hypothetical protein